MMIPNRVADSNRPFSDNQVAELNARKRSIYVLVSRATTAGGLSPKGYTGCRQTGPGNLPLAIRLSEGLGPTLPSRPAHCHDQREERTHREHWQDIQERRHLRKADTNRL